MTEAPPLPRDTPIAPAIARTWLVSYPKSGNTWFRFVLFHLMHGKMPEHSRALDAFCNSTLPPAPGERFKKSHATPVRLSASMKPKDRVVYVLRHPLDVMASALSYARLTGKMGGGIAELADAYLRAGGHPDWIDSHPHAGTWAGNVASWQAEERWPVHHIRYEAALADPAGTVTALARFVGLTPTEGEVAACVVATRFEALKAFEERELSEAARTGKVQGRFSGPARQKAAAQGARFFREGRSGGYSSVLTPRQLDEARRVFGDAAERSGYVL